MENNHNLVSNALLTTERMTRLAVCNTFTSQHFTELIANKLQEIPENIRAKHSISPSMVPGPNNHSLSTLREQIIDWAIAKMKVRKAIITNALDDNCKPRQNRLQDASDISKQQETKYRI